MSTEQKLSRFDHHPTKYTPNSISAVDWSAPQVVQQSVFVGSKSSATEILSATSPTALLDHLRFAIHHRSEDRIFWTFDALLAKEELPTDTILTAMQEYPSLAYSTLKSLLGAEDSVIAEAFRARITIAVAQGVIRSSNTFGIASLVALEKLGEFIGNCELPVYLDLLWLAGIAVRSPPLAQEVMLVMHDARVSSTRQFSNVYRYAHQQALATIFDRVEEAADACPCDEQGRPKRQRTAPVAAKLCPIPPPKNAEPSDDISEHQEPYLIPSRVLANIRVDLPTSIRIHSHIRLRVASPAEHSTLPPAVVDAIVVRSSRGELNLDVVQPLPPEYDTVDWRLYQAGSIVTSKAMVDALSKLAVDGLESCAFRDIISGQAHEVEEVEENAEHGDIPTTLNPSQRSAVASAQLECFSLIWGPPGMSCCSVPDLRLTCRQGQARPQSWCRFCCVFCV